MDRLFMDIRYAVRSLMKRPTTTGTIVVTLALGIGANAAVFGVVDALLLHPYTMADVDRIVMPMSTSPTFIGHRETVSPADFLDWRRDLRGGAIEHVAATAWWDANLVGRDEPERVLGFFVSPEFFAALDTPPAIGRTFLAEEELAANAKRVMLSDGLWRRRFGSDPGVVGRTVLIDGTQWLVVGVMPPGFGFPMQSELWAPLSFDEKAARNRASHYLTVFGRLAGGRSLADAQAQLTAIARRLASEHPETNAQRGAVVHTLSRGMSDVGIPQVLGLWQAAGLFVLLIACANIANLLLARAAEREREIAIRLALGSSRGRIVRESLVESAILVAVSIPLALTVAWASLRVMHALMPARIVRFIAGWDRLGLDVWTIGVTLGCAAVAALIFGTLPAVHMARGIVADALKSDGRTGAGPGRQRIRRALVVAEIALALPLLVAATLSVSTITRFLTGWQGYEPSNVLTMRAVLPDSRYPDADSRARFATAAIERLTAVSGARDVAAGNVLPAIDSNAKRAIEVAGQPIAEQSKWPRVDYRLVSPRYFDVLRMPLLAGRAFTTADQKASEPVAIVSESMARRYFPGQDPIGRSFSVSASYVGAWARNLAAAVDNNYPVFTPTATAANVNSRRPYLPGTIGAANVLSSIFGSDYNGLQLSAERRGSRLSGKAYYSYGRGYEDVDFQGGGLPGVQNAARLADERGRNSNDRTQSFVLSGVWRLDYLKGSSSPLRVLARDWTVSAIATLQSGQPLTIGAGQDRNLDGLTNDRADLVGNPALDSGRSRDELIEGWFNVAAFANPALGTNGSSGRSIIDGPGYRNVDLGIFRDVPLRGRSLFQFRIEATNVFNIVNLNNPGTNLAAPATFGKIRSARNMRQIQLGARVSF